MAVVGLLALTGCGTEASERDARGAVQRFYSAFAAQDGAAACEQLSEDAASALETSEKEPCERAVLSLDLTPSAPGGASVWVTSARVSLDSGDTAFLDQISGQWLIAAAGCRPQRGKPYECELEG